MSDIHLGRGSPDWGLPVYQGSASQVDLGQVIAVLTQFDRIDQRGRISFAENWSAGYNAWTRGRFGAAVLPDVVTEPAGISFVPPCCLRMTPGAPGADESYVTRQVYLGKSKRLGLESALAFIATSGDVSIQIEYRPVGGPSKRGRLWYQPFNGNWSIDTSNNGTVIVANRPASTSQTLYQQVKFVADWGANKYISVAIGDTTFDLDNAGHTLLVSAMTEDGRCVAKVSSNGGAAGSGRALCGYVVLTRDEP